jgi:hypothetical protein
MLKAATPVLLVLAVLGTAAPATAAPPELRVCRRVYVELPAGDPGVRVCPDLWRGLSFDTRAVDTSPGA